MPARKTARRGGFTYDERTGRYRTTSGRFVPQTAVRRALERRVEAAGRDMQRLAEQLRSGQITTTAWRERMRIAMRDTHLFSSAVVRGGWQQMTPADFGRVGARMKEQLRFLDKFAAQIDAGLPLDGRFNRRAQLYALAARQTAHRTETTVAQTRGFDEERNILQAGESCEGNGSCVAESARGWVPVGTLIPIGGRLCLGRCRCVRQLRNSATGETRAA